MQLRQCGLHRIDEGAQPRRLLARSRKHDMHRQCRRLPVRQQLHQTSLCEVVGHQPGRDHRCAQPGACSLLHHEQVVAEQAWADRQRMRAALCVMQQQAFAVVGDQ